MPAILPRRNELSMLADSRRGPRSTRRGGTLPTRLLSSYWWSALRCVVWSLYGKVSAATVFETEDAILTPVSQRPATAIRNAEGRGLEAWRAPRSGRSATRARGTGAVLGRGGWWWFPRGRSSGGCVYAPRLVPAS